MASLSYKVFEKYCYREVPINFGVLELSQKLLEYFPNICQVERSAVMDILYKC
jgi:hypothetical protein